MVVPAPTLVSCEPSPINDVAVTVPTTLTPVELIVTADPTTVEVNVGSSVNLIVEAAPVTVNDKLLLLISISLILSADPTRVPSSTVKPKKSLPSPMALPSDLQKK